MSKKKQASSKKEEALSSIKTGFGQFLLDNKIIEDIGENSNVLPTGIDLLDSILGGGFSMNFVQVVGHSGGGKSTLVSKIIANGQEIWGEDFISVYCDSEQSMSERRLKSLGAKLPVQLINDVTIEKVFKIIENLVVYKEMNKKYIDIPSIIVLDSLANTPSEKQTITEDHSETLGATKAKIWANYLPTAILKLKKYNICLMCVNQYRQKIDMNPYAKAEKPLKFMNQNYNIPGGNSVYYNSYQLIEVKQKKEIETYGFPAINTEIKLIKNKNFTPNIIIDVVCNYSKGFLNFWTNFEMLKKYKYISATKTCSLKSCPQPTFYTKNAIKTYLENEEWREAFDKDVEDCIKVNFIDKYDDMSSNILDINRNGELQDLRDNSDDPIINMDETEDEIDKELNELFEGEDSDNV